MSIRHMKKYIQGSHYFSFFALFKFLHTGQLTASEHANMYIAYIVYYYICLPLCANILYFDTATFSIKKFSFIYFTVSVVRQQNEYEKVIETRRIKTT